MRNFPTEVVLFFLINPSQYGELRLKLGQCHDGPLLTLALTFPPSSVNFQSQYILWHDGFDLTIWFPYFQTFSLAFHYLVKGDIPRENTIWNDPYNQYEIIETQFPKLSDAFIEYFFSTHCAPPFWSLPPIPRGRLGSEPQPWLLQRVLCGPFPCIRLSALETHSFISSALSVPSYPLLSRNPLPKMQPGELLLPDSYLQYSSFSTVQ